MTHTLQEKLAALEKLWRDYARNIHVKPTAAIAYRNCADELTTLLSEHGGDSLVIGECGWVDPKTRDDRSLIECMLQNYARGSDNGNRTQLAAAFACQNEVLRRLSEHGGGGEAVAGELLPCPFCGAHASRWDYDTSRGNVFGVCCSNDGCPADVYAEGDSREAADAAWNRRTTPPTPSVPTLKVRDAIHGAVEVTKVSPGDVVAEERELTPSAPVVDDASPRFFIDHGVVHDRATGQHVGASFEDDSAERLLALLTRLEQETWSWRMTAKALNAALSGVSANVGVEAVGEVRIQDSFIVSTSIKRPLADGGYDVVPQRLTPPAAPSVSPAVEGGTPSSRWSANGEPDPHGSRYDCERAALAMGDMTDDELANAVFLHGNERPSIADMASGKALPAIAYLTAAKDRIRWLSRRLATAEQPVHPDDAAVDRFAAAMKAKLAKKRAEGRGGWDDPEQCTVEFLSELLHRHVRKGDPVDVGNIAMMLHQRGSGIHPEQPGSAAQGEAVNGQLAEWLREKLHNLSVDYRHPRLADDLRMICSCLAPLYTTPPPAPVINTLKVRDAIHGTLDVSKVFPCDIVAEERDFNPPPAPAAEQGWGPSYKQPWQAKEDATQPEACGVEETCQCNPAQAYGCPSCGRCYACHRRRFLPPLTLPAAAPRVLPSVAGDAGELPEPAAFRDILDAIEHCASASDEGVDYAISRPMIDALTTLGLLQKTGRGLWTITEEGKRLASYRRLAASGQGVNWLPIETAPRDGTLIDIWAQSLIDLADGGQQVAVEFRVPDASWFDGQWCNSDGNPHDDLEGFTNMRFTHWMPLPAAPTQENQE